MLKPKSKIKLSENLRMGVAGPSSQSTFYKYGGVVFLVLSLFLAYNIYHNVKNDGLHFGPGTVATSSNLQQQVLGAYDDGSNNSASNYTTYKVQKGDTIFMIAQQQGISWDIVATLNKMKAPYTLHVGQTLKLPPAPQNQN